MLKPYEVISFKTQEIRTFFFFADNYDDDFEEEDSKGKSAIYNTLKCENLQHGFAPLNIRNI